MFVLVLAVGFIGEESEAARELFETGPVKPSREARAKADAFFRAVVRGD